MPILECPLPHYPRLPTRRTFPSFDARAASYLASTSYDTHVPVRLQVSPGVWSDGKDCVLSAAHPAVQSLLSQARSTYHLPPTSSDVIFALAALDVFYKPADPAHWLFWSDEKKLSTAKVVNRIALHQPPLIRSNVAWNGIPEYLCILANQHGTTWRQFYEKKPWYQIIVPPKETASSKVINLRKRKAAPGAFREPSRTPPVEDADVLDEPRPKRLRAQRHATPAKTAGVYPPRNDPSEPIPSTSRQINVTHPASSHHPLADLPAPLPAVLPDDAAQADDCPRSSNRKRRKAPSRYPASLRSRESSSSPGVEPPTADSSDIRVRSSSHTSSESTVVAPDSEQGRSGSVASSSTTVTSTHPKELKPDGMMLDDPQEAKSLEDSDARSEGSVDSEGMVTRGRASRTRSDGSNNEKRSGEATAPGITPVSRVKGGKPSASRARTRKTAKA